MAKGKHATALFEVIHSGRKPPKASPTGGIATPRWWFKGRRQSESPDESTHHPEPPPPQIIERIVEKQVFIDRPVPMRMADDKAVDVDSANGEINFKLSYAGAAAAGFILIIVLAIAYLVGSRSNQSAEYFQRAEPASPTDNLLAAVTPAPKAVTAPVAPQITPDKIITIHPEPDVQPTPASQPQARQVGLNYVIVQSYPDPAISHRAADFLNKAGIPCTVEQLPGWSWTSVITMKGFDHIQHNADLDAFKDKLVTLGETFAGRSQFNQFHPSLKKWQGEQQ